MSVKGEGQFTVYVVGAEEVLAKIEEVKGWVSYILTTEPGKVAEELRDRIRQKAESLFTRRTGRLFESIKAHPISGSDAWMVTAGGAQAPYACLPEYQEIPTLEGFKSAKEIKEGVVVFSHPYGKVKKVWTYQYEGILYGIRRAKSNQIDWFTPDHKILAIKGQVCPLHKSYDYFCRPNCKLKKAGDRDLSKCPPPWWENDPEFIPIKELRPGDFIAVPRYKPQLIDLNELSNRFGVEITPELMRLVGYYLAEGHYYEPYKQVYFSISEEEEDFRDDIVDLMEKYFDAKPFIRPSKGKAISIGFSGILDRLPFFMQFGKYAFGKYLPDWVFDLPDEHIRELIFGFYVGDGCHKKQEDLIETTSPMLAMGFKILFERLGYPPTIEVYDKRGKRVTILDIETQYNHRSIRLSLSSLSWRAFIRDQPPPYLRNAVITRDYIFYRIKEIRQQFYGGPIYDFTIDPHHYFHTFSVVASNSYWEFGWCHHKSGRCFRRPFFYNTAYEYAKENNLEFGGGVFPERIISLYGRERGERIIKGLGEVGITKRFSKRSFRSSAKVRVRKVKTPKFRIRR